MKMTRAGLGCLSLKVVVNYLQHSEDFIGFSQGFHKNFINKKVRFELGSNRFWLDSQIPEPRIEQVPEPTETEPERTEPNFAVRLTGSGSPKQFRTELRQHY